MAANKNQGKIDNLTRQIDHLEGKKAYFMSIYAALGEYSPTGNTPKLMAKSARFEEKMDKKIARLKEKLEEITGPSVIDASFSVQAEETEKKEEKTENLSGKEE